MSPHAHALLLVVFAREKLHLPCRHLSSATPQLLETLDAECLAAAPMLPWATAQTMQAAQQASQVYTAVAASAACRLVVEQGRQASPPFSSLQCTRKQEHDI